MAPKRSRDDPISDDKPAAEPPIKKKKGFTVGPANLPDGTYRRKGWLWTRQIYTARTSTNAFLSFKAEELASAPSKSVYETIDHDTDKDGSSPQEQTAVEMHPERQAMLNEPEAEKAPKPDHPQDRNGRRKRKPKPSAFAKEMAIAEQRRKAAEKRREEREFRQKDREAMARARRPDQHGKRRLGRESQVLLSRVQRMVGQT
ncbi:conserved hypothetical protein [Aspergillus terreus NIH2624]|uniref:rRNA-processing protein FYV7 n=1 Tax=Aspergillus terreus (strain NIH 2624 / FGSC A1156) TaxID=341663 RepID=Q0D0R2_ASPTN|nr:uncharacterized protein ATEG_00472 [Aspergillus terreus NIH2624]EAU39118.1 conserved hypothetical protein [Aspergillus terreus NIH2624]